MRGKAWQCSKMASFSGVEIEGPVICRFVVEQERNDCLVTIHTSIARGDVWCKKQSFLGLPQTARSVIDEEEEDDDEKFACEKNLL